MNNTVTTVAITLFSYWVIGFVIYVFTKEDDRIGAIWGMGLLYWLLYVVFYPFRVMRHYNQYKTQYQKQGISRLQYFFGKRPPKRGM